MKFDLPTSPAAFLLPPAIKGRRYFFEADPTNQNTNAVIRWLPQRSQSRDRM